MYIPPIAPVPVARITTLASDVESFFGFSLFFHSPWCHLLLLCWGHSHQKLFEAASSCKNRQNWEPPSEAFPSAPGSEPWPANRVRSSDVRDHQAQDEPPKFQFRLFHLQVWRHWLGASEGITSSYAFLIGFEVTASPQCRGDPWGYGQFKQWPCQSTGGRLVPSLDGHRRRDVWEDLFISEIGWSRFGPQQSRRWSYP